MGAMCGNVARGWLMVEIEKHMNTMSNPDQFKQALEANQSDVSQALFDGGILDGKNAIHREMQIHLADHWISSGRKSWWPQCLHKNEILRQGFILAIQSMKEKCLPITIIWICAGHHFQCAVSDNGTTVTLLILTPHTPFGRAYPASVESESIVIVGSEADIDEIVQDATNHGGRPTKEDCADLGRGVFTAPLYRPSL